MNDIELSSYTSVIKLIHKGEYLKCPKCQNTATLGIHRRRRAPVFDYQCARCKRVFNAWTGTFLQGTHLRPSQLLRILCGIALNESNAQIGRAAGCKPVRVIGLKRRILRTSPDVLERTLIELKGRRISDRLDALEREIGPDANQGSVPRLWLG
jgi:transposase-like protein